jgi:hypothetical protein
MRSKILITIIAVAAVVGIGVGVGFLAGRGAGNSQHGTGTDLTSSGDASATASTPHAHTTAAAENPAPELKPGEPDTMPQIIHVVPADTNAVAGSETNWEDKIDDIVGSDEADTNKVKQLFALFPTLPADGQEEVVQHLSNLVEDDNYGPLGDLLKNAKLPEGVLDELLADVLNRPNNLKLPLLLDVASNSDHAKKDEAKDLLELYLGDDYGSDWNKWGQAMTNWMQQNPD